MTTTQCHASNTLPLKHNLWINGKESSVLDSNDVLAGIISTWTRKNHKICGGLMIVANLSPKKGSSNRLG